MAHGLNSVLKRANNGGSAVCKGEGGSKTGIGSRRIFAPHFKLQVLDSYRNDSDCKGNQRATARKYGIHRRQIQKWLQAENNLRNTVGKCKSESNSENPDASRKCVVDVTLANCGHRQRDDTASFTARLIYNSEPRVPPCPTSPVQIESWPNTTEDNLNNNSNYNNSDCGIGSRLTPLDFSTHSRGGHTSPIVANPEASPASPVPADPAAPIDLSLKKVAVLPAGASAAPVLGSPLTPPAPSRPTQSPHSLARPHPDVWDLSTKGASAGGSCCFPANNASTTPKPVKLFKPYLLDEEEAGDDDQNNNIKCEDGCGGASAAAYQRELTPPCCSSAYLINANCDLFYYNNNNNNLCDIKSEYAYTIQELHPDNKGYYYRQQQAPPPPPPLQCVSYTMDYEMQDYCPTYEDISYTHPLTPLKQRQSYSLDFKLSAIDCYYQDDICRGNQRAVASKYNIHRRQVQKWLKQADELRQRNENIKQVNAVS